MVRVLIFSNVLHGSHYLTQAAFRALVKHEKRQGGQPTRKKGLTCDALLWKDQFRRKSSPTKIPRWAA